MADVLDVNHWQCIDHFGDRPTVSYGDLYNNSITYTYAGICIYNCGTDGAYTFICKYLESPMNFTDIFPQTVCHTEGFLR